MGDWEMAARNWRVSGMQTLYGVEGNISLLSTSGTVELSTTWPSTVGPSIFGPIDGAGGVVVRAVEVVGGTEYDRYRLKDGATLHLQAGLDAALTLTNVGNIAYCTFNFGATAPSV